MLPPNENRHDGNEKQGGDCKAEGKAVEDIEGCQDVVCTTVLALIDGLEDAYVVSHAQAGVVQIV